MNNLLSDTFALNAIKLNSLLTKKISPQKLLASLFFFRFHTRLIIIIFALLGSLAGVLSPWYQKQFINQLIHTGNGDILFLLVIAIFFSFLSPTFSAIVKLISARESSIYQNWLSNEVYKHLLQLSHSARKSKTIGETISFISQDVPSAAAILEDVLPTFLNSMLPIIIGPIAISLIYDINILYVTLIIAINIVISISLGYRQAKFFKLNKFYAEKRISIVNEWLQNIKIIRILNWVERFEAKIKLTRIDETNNRLNMVTNGSTMNSIAQVTPSIINIAGVLTLIAAKHNQVSPGDIFSVLWIFGVFIARPIRMLPFAIVNISDAMTSVERLRSFFSLHTEPVKNYELNKEVNYIKNKANSIEISGLNFHAEGRHLLKDISLHVPAGGFFAIIGEVGSGKTLLLNAILLQIECDFAKYYIDNRDAKTEKMEFVRSHFCYVPQEGFVMSASLRENVMFLYNAPIVHDEEVSECLNLSQFNLEEENFNGGLDTEIGERGVNLSGGQKQRVNIARSAYYDRPVILLDDCLSAVDIDTERKLIDELFMKEWVDKTRIIVTHRMSILEQVDKILFMENGSIVEEGTFTELIQKSNRMQKFVESHKKNIREGKSQ